MLLNKYQVMAIVRLIIINANFEAFDKLTLLSQNIIFSAQWHAISIQFFHRLILMSVIPDDNCERFRTFLKS